MVTPSATPTSSGVAKGSTGKSTTKGSTGTPTVRPTMNSGSPRAFGAGGGGGGGFNNPAFTSCLKDNGVVLTPGTRPDRADPKIAAALQTCFAKLGGGFPRGGGAPSGAPSTNP